MEPDSELISKVRELDRNGRSLDAWALLDRFPPPEEWANPEHQVAAAVLIESLGGLLRAKRLVYRLWRRREARPFSRQFMAAEVIRRRGARMAWAWMQAHPPLPGEDEERHRNYLGTLAYLRIQFRDFEQARSILDPLLESDPGYAWGHALLGHLLARQDLHGAALDAARRALEMRPALNFGLHVRNEALLALGRDREALDLLHRSTAEMQSFEILWPLVQLQVELNLYDGALATLERMESLAPLLEAAGKAGIAARRCDLASAKLDHKEALAQARAAAGEFPFYAKVAEKLEQAGERLVRKVLPVGFVAQHHLTCAPATLSAIAAFLGSPVEHLDLADAICYDGTPDYRERNWAEKSGWACREFAVTFDAVKALIDRGIPLGLTTVDADSAHAQAVIGYDEFRRVFFVRDPSFRTTSEFLALEALEAQQPFGPRGFAMVPEAEEHRFDGIDLPDRDLYDLKHRIDFALFTHDRPAAMDHIETFRSQHPSTRLRWFVELALAGYDRNNHARLAALEELLKLFPGVVNWKLMRFDVIRELNGRQAYRRALEEECEAKDVHPLLLRALARDLHWEAGTSAEALRLLRRIHRIRLDSWALATEANILWQKREWEKATELYRIASCLDDKNESLAMSYFRSARWIGRAEEALALLRGRVLRDGGRSGQPAVCLYDALEALDRTGEAIGVLEAACARRPEDAELALTFVRALTSIGDLDRAESRLASIKGIAAPSSWSRTAARIARYRADGRGEFAAWTDVLRVEPTAGDGHRRITRLLEALEGREAAVQHIRAACERFPFDWELHMIQWESAGKEGPGATEKAVRELLRIDPSSAFAWRELALIASERRSFDEALEAIERARESDPVSPWQYNVHGIVLERQGRFAEARDAFRRGIESDVDAIQPMQNLLRLSEGPEQRMDSLRFIQGELTKQVSNGDAIMEFADFGRAYLSEAELESFLLEWRERRPDLWQTGVRLSQHLRERSRLDEAVSVMQEVCARFPLLPRVWVELAECHGHRDERESQIEALSKVRVMNPEWGFGMRRLAIALRQAGRVQDALDVMEQALRHAREDSWNHVAMADILWRLDRKSEAVDSLAFALELEPEYGGGWSQLREWEAEAGRAGAVRQAAERLIRERSAQSRAWLVYASVLDGELGLDEQLAALDRAIELDPLSIDGFEEKARILARAGRFQEGLDLCKAYPAAVAPPLLMAREAWIRWVVRDRDAALARVQEAVAADPGFLWGWSLLREWQRERADLDGEEAALIQLCRLEPGEPARLVELADLRARRNDREGQAAALRRALSIAPDHLAAFRSLSRQLMEERRFEEAEAHIRQFGGQHLPAEAAAHWFEWHWRQERFAEAVAAIGDFVGRRRGVPGLCDRILEVLRAHPSNQGFGLIEQALAGAVLEGAPGRGFAAGIYAGLMRQRGRTPREDVMACVCPADPGGEEALVRHFNLIGDAWAGRVVLGMARARQAKALAKLLGDRDAELRPLKDIYGAAGYALTALGQYEEAVRWMRDWRERQDLEPYMYYNLVRSLQHLGRDGEAALAIKRCVQHPVQDGCVMHMKLLVCIDALLGSRPGDARAHLDSILREDLMEGSIALYDMAAELMRFQRGSPRRRFLGPPLRALLRLGKTELPGRFVERLRHRICAHMARHNRSLLPRIWAALFF